jgi:oligopeptide transport system ATP-binding protein
MVIKRPVGLQRDEPMSVLLSVEDLKKYFPLTRGILWERQIGLIKAVDGLSFTIRKGETLGLVGESGCGKTTTGRCIVGLEQPTSGKIMFEGKDIDSPSGLDLRKLQGKIQIIFQDPQGSLDPRMRAEEIIAEPLMIEKISRSEARERVEEVMSLVGLDPEMMNRYPHMFSGGQRQRISVARAVIRHPGLIVCDEPVSALDVSIQAQIINLLMELQEKLGHSYLFIAHDLSVVRNISTRVAVMYLGRIVEIVRAAELFGNPLHFYTKALISAVPIPDPAVERERNRILLQGEVPSPLNPPSGCRFHDRCRGSQERCKEQEPQLKEEEPDHWVACWFASDKMRE